jgi:PTH2 family peptidyl-tRNA hydrolase
VLKAEREIPKTLDRYMERGARKIVCEVADEDTLRRLFGEATAVGLIASLIKDAGHTEIPAGTVTVVGIGPGGREDIDALTGSLPLVS